MKNKGFTYGLLVVVGIIWYQVFIRVKSNFANDFPIESEYRVSNYSKIIRKPQEFTLKANFQDPFHTGSIENKTSIESTISPQNFEINPIQPIKKVPKKINWPSIKYYGFVRNTNSKSPRILISIDNHIFKLNKGDEVLDNIRIVAADRGIVVVRYKGEENVFVTE